mmetsp:Transcript_7850/g.15717  ORF Transcript_7850/g.15717 Transcript_7850/m.15717 type:complete len:275 (-) Transcript_7850:242-1066(-)
MMLLSLLTASPALRAGPPVMQLKSSVQQMNEQFSQQQVAPVGNAPPSNAPPGNAGFNGNVVPTQATLQQKVDMLRNELGLSNGRQLTETIAEAVQVIGLEEEVKAFNMLQTVDACLQTLGTEIAGAEPAGAPQSKNGALVRRGPPPLGYGDSYEGAMFGDYGYGGYGGYSPFGNSYGYGRGGLGWGGYGRDSPWDVAYGGYSGYSGYRGYRGYGPRYGYGYGGYSTCGLGGFGSWGPYAGYGGLRYGSAAERAIARADARAAMRDGRMTGDGRM